MPRVSRFSCLPDACRVLLFCLAAILPAGCVTEQPSTPVPARVKLFQTQHALTASDVLPPQEGRPDRLKVQTLPKPVRICMVDDAVACEYAGKLESLLRDGPTGEECDSFIVQAGFASLSRNVAQGRNLIRIVGMVPLSGEVQPYATHSFFVREKKDAQAFIRFFVEIARSDGTCTIRSLTTEEMDKWWCYISFDIGEPVYLVETDGGKYKFVVTYSTEGLLLSIDELNSLPDVENGRFVDTPGNREKIERCRSRQ